MIMIEDSSSETPNESGYPGAIRQISLLGVKIHAVDMATTLDTAKGWIAQGGPHQIVTADASAVVLAQDDDEFREIINRADLVTPDGAGILLGAKWLHMPLECRVSGVDIAKNLCRMAAEDGFSVFLLGAAPGIAERAAENLKSEFPSLEIAGTQHGYFQPSEEAGIVERIRESGAKVLLVALGFPKQEKFIRKHFEELGVCVAIGVGGSLDVFSGAVRRAPEWMQQHGLEWAYRLAQNPRKISKVMTLPRFICLVLKEKVRRTIRKNETDEF